MRYVRLQSRCSLTVNRAGLTATAPVQMSTNHYSTIYVYVFVKIIMGRLGVTGVSTSFTH